MNAASRLRSLSLACLALAGLPGCETIRVVSDHDPSFSFAGYDSYAWISEHPMVSSERGLNPLLEGRIMAAIQDSLGQKGMKLVADPARADFVVAFGVGARDRVSVTSTPYPVAYRGAWRWGAGYYNDVDVRQYTEGRLAIDIFDAAEKRPVFHGYATANISATTDPAKRQQMLRNAVSRILAEFPAKAGRIALPRSDPGSLAPGNSVCPPRPRPQTARSRSSCPCRRPGNGVLPPALVLPSRNSLKFTICFE